MAITYLSGERIQGTSVDRLGVSYDQNVNTSSRTFGVSSRKALGVKISAGHYLVGKTITQFKMSVSQDADGAGTCRVYVIRDGSGSGGNDQEAVSDAVTIPTGTNLTAINMIFTFSGGVTILANDIIAIVRDDAGVMTGICQTRTHASDTDSNAKLVSIDTTSATSFEYGDFGNLGSTDDLRYIATGVSAVMPTDVPAGTRYEETDARKIFRMAEHTTSDLGTGGDVAEVGSVTAQSTNKLLGSNALDLDGASGTYINMNNILNCMTTTGTISFWARSEGTSAYTIAWSDTNGLSYFHITSEHGGSNAHCRVDMTVSNTIQWKVQSPTGTWGSTDRGWKHIVITQDGTNAKLYFNGTEQTTFVTTTDKSKWISHVTTAGADNVRWGVKNVYNQGNQGAWGGQLDDFAIWNRAITADEVTTLYNGGTGRLATSISGTGMKVYYSCNSLSGSTLVNECPTTNPEWKEKCTA